MNRLVSLNRIKTLLSRFVTEVELSGAMYLQDINSVSEDFLIQLLSVIFEHSDLKNLNWSEKANYPAIDLGDYNSRIAYQITSTPDSQKLKKTLKKFMEHKLYDKFDRLVFYILTRKKDYRVDFKEITQDKLTFEKNQDILDSNALIREIRELPDDKLSKVEELLEQQFGEETDDSQDIMEWIESVNNYWLDEDNSSKIEVDRKTVRNNLYDFVSRENGVVIGRPGVGKTHLLKELLQDLRSANIPHLLLSIDLLGDSDPKEWPDGLSFNGDLIEHLKSVPISDNKAILLFDGFDAARDERKRKNFLILIKRAIQDLENWNVAVTVRTYDAKKSQELLDLFGNSDDTDYQTQDISCRHFTIPPFTEDEILQALVQIGCPISIYNNGSDEFKETVLTNPFNLWLLEKILENLSDEDLNSLSQIRSEVQLFDQFWQRRIESADNEIDRLSVLEGIVREMVKQRSLRIRQIDVRKSLIQTALDDLFSDEILKRVSSTGQGIAFSHNILFDYAISVLLIDDEPKQLEKFITKDPSRPLFLRPSITYFFTRLWYYKNSESFWDAFWYILRSDQSVSIRLVARLIPPSVIANEAREIEQLKPLIQKIQDMETNAADAITRLFQALQTLQIKREKPWIDFCDQASEYLHIDFAWDLANLTSDILEKTESSYIVNTCGYIGRRLLEWVWQEREEKKDEWYNRFGGHWGVSLVAKTYYTNLKASRALLEKALDLTKEDNFPIGFLTRLTANVDNICKYDPEFAIQIYFTTFSHEFKSEGKTRRGSDILPITTYRSQDFRMCQYRLVQHFPKFLQEKPIDATQAAIRSLNYIIAKEHILRFSRKDMTIEELNEPFSFHGKTANFVQDHSHIWDAQNSSGESIEMADAMFDYMAELAKSEDQHNLLDSLLDVFVDHVESAFFWKRLLKTASQFPKVFARRLFELCLAKPILLHLEVSYELSLFLENAASEFARDNRLRQIEERILALPNEAQEQENDEYLIMHRDSLLARIPMELLSSQDAKSIREKMEQENRVPENRPPVSFHFESGTVTEEKWLRDKGVDTTTSENQKLKAFSDTLEDFISDWRNKTPTKESTDLIIPKLSEVYVVIGDKTNTDEELINILWRKMTECAAIIGRDTADLDDDSFALCRNILLEGASHRLPDPETESEAQFDSLGYSPYPRHEAAIGLIRLTFDKPDTKMLDAIETLAKDKVPSVRMITAMYLTNIYGKNSDRFWRIINQRSESETNLVVHEALYNALNYIVAHKQENENKTVSVMKNLLKHTTSPGGKFGSSDPFISLLMWLVIVRENFWTINFIKETYFSNPIQNSDILTRIVAETMDSYVNPKHMENNEGTKILKRSIEYLNEVISVSINTIKDLRYLLNQNPTEETNEELQNMYRAIDQVISSLYYTFAHDRIETEKQTDVISYDLRCRFYDEVKPLMEQVIGFADDPDTGVMFASTAHDFVKLLTSFLICNPKEVLHLAERVARSSERFGYNLDSLAVEDVVKLVEIVLADYRHVVRDDEDFLKSLLNLLDLFAKTGWSDALKLVWRLDEVFR